MTKQVQSLLSETSLSRVWSHMKEHDSGMITAFRGAKDCGSGDAYTKAENLKRNASLKAKLRSGGFGVTVVKGSYIENYGSANAKEVGEQSFLVVDLNDGGKLEKTLRLLGEEFEQDSILFIPKGGQTGQLIGTNHCEDGYPGYGKKVNLKNPVFGQKGEFMTRVNGRPFILKEDVRELPPLGGVFDRWGNKIASNTPWENLSV